MSILNSTPLLMGDEGGYQISRSVRLRSSASASFTRTLGTPTDNRKWTLSGWFKLASTSSVGLQANNGAAATWLGLGDGGITLTKGVSGVSIAWNTVTAAIFRDFSAWYHGVWVYDSAQATASNRVKFYINGIQQTTSGTYPPLNETTEFNSAIGHTIFNGNIIGAKDGYLTETNFIDGQALTPSSFGEFNAITGVWQPKKYAGTYGTNGFYLNFSDNSAATAAAIGKDSSGNGNNWTPNNISVTAGVTYDSMIDTPTPYADGGNGRGNYAVWNPIDHPTTFIAPTNGNLSQNCNTSAWTLCVPTLAIPDGSGLWQWELVQTGTANGANAIGVCLTTVQASITGSPSTRAGCSGVDNTGNTFINGAASGSITYPTVGNTVTCLYDATNRTLQVFDNGTSRGTIIGLPAGDVRPFVAASSSNGSPTFVANFGQTNFAYNKGGKALNTQNLPASTIENGANYMAATLYTGNGSTQSITNTANGVSFEPGLVWLKARSTLKNHGLFNTVVGIYKGLASNATDAEYTDSSTLTAFNSNGFSLGSNTTFNQSAVTQVAWQWKAGGTAVTNTAGSISSQVSANASAGFSVVTYTGTGANATVGHGLGVAPKMVIVKERGNVNGWYVYHATLGNTKCVYLDSTSGQATVPIWNNTTPTSAVISFNTGVEVNRNGGTYVAYCFAEVAGYSKFGSYVGNGSADGTFVYLGFRPRWVLIKNAGAADQWYLVDTSRDLSNPSGLHLYPNLSNAEFSPASSFPIDILSNGFKVRTASAGWNTSGQTYIYACFAENPFKNALAR